MTRYRAAFCPTCNADRLLMKNGRCIQCGQKVKLPPAGGWNAEPVTGAYSGKPRDSKQEARREAVLQALLNAGRITDLDFKPGSFSLDVYGTQAVDELLAYVRDVDGDTNQLSRLIANVERSRQRIGGYTPDFSYRDHAGALVVEDVKGYRINRDFPLRKKLMVACHNVEVQVIREQRGVQQFARGAGAKGRGTGSRLMGGR